MKTDSKATAGTFVVYGDQSIKISFPEGAREVADDQAHLLRAADGLAHALGALYVLRDQDDRADLAEKTQHAIHGLQFILGTAVAIADAADDQEGAA